MKHFLPILIFFVILACIALIFTRCSFSCQKSDDDGYVQQILEELEEQLKRSEITDVDYETLLKLKDAQNLGLMIDNNESSKKEGFWRDGYYPYYGYTTYGYKPYGYHHYWYPYRRYLRPHYFHNFPGRWVRHYGNYYYVRW